MLECVIVLRHSRYSTAEPPPNGPADRVPPLRHQSCRLHTLHISNSCLDCGPSCKQWQGPIRGGRPEREPLNHNHKFPQRRRARQVVVSAAPGISTKLFRHKSQVLRDRYPPKPQTRQLQQTVRLEHDVVPVVSRKKEIGQITSLSRSK